MMRRTCTTVLFCMLIFSIFTVFLPVGVCEETSGSTLYVGGTGDGNYSSIQDAINASASGDTVYVYSGTYSTYDQEIFIDKSITLTGEDKETTIIDGGENGRIIVISVDGVTITGFTIQNSGSDYFMYKDNGDAGILIVSDNNKIFSNVIQNNFWGVRIALSSYNNVHDNIIRNNSDFALLLDRSMYCTVSNNTFESGGGISMNEGMLEWWNTHTIENNTVDGKPIRYYTNMNDIVVPEDTGQVILANCNNFVIQNLNLSDVDTGIQLYYSSQSIISRNTIKNDLDSIILYYSDNNDIFSNIITNNRYNGMFLSYSSNNTIYKNNITGNRNGIKLIHSVDNTIYNTTLSNTENAIDYSSNANHWDDNSSSGNYWSDYTGIDNDGDGIGDTPYVIYTYTNNQDNYPLMNPYSGDGGVGDDGGGTPGFELILVICAITLVLFWKRKITS